MTGDGGVTPERLAQLVDGAAPETEAEREAVALMAEVRGLAEPAPEAVRERVRAIAASGGAEPHGWRRWMATAGGRRRLALAGAPVAAAIVALAVAIPAMTGDGGGTAPQASGGVPATAEAGRGGGASGAARGPVATQAAPQRAAGPRDAATGPAPEAASAAPAPEAFSSAAPPADGAATAPADGAATAMELDRAVARARSALEDAGATSVRTREAPDGTQAVVVAEVPADAVDAATTALERQGAEVVAQAGEAGTATVRATVTPGG